MTTSTKSLLKRAALIVALTALPLPSAFAQTFWTGDVSADWHDPDNWTDGVPGPADRANVYGGWAELFGSATIADLYLRNGGGVAGIVDVTGNGTILLVDDYLSVGGDSIVRFTQAAQGDLGRLVLGEAGNGTIEISGNGTIVTVDGQATIGRDAGFTGRMDIIGGGKLTNDFGVIGSASSAIGEVNVIGAGSQWTNNLALLVGFSGQGVIRIADGGKVASAGASLGMSPSFLGGPPASGLVVLSGADSLWESSDEIVLGHAGNGIIVLGSFVGDAPGEAGTLDAPSIRMASGATGSAVLVFNHIGTDYEFNADIESGPGDAIIMHADGTTLFNSDASAFSGLTQVGGGAFHVNNVLGGQVYVDGGRLSGMGRLTGSVQIDDGVLAPGNSIGRLTIEQDLVFSLDSTYEVEVRAGGNLAGIHNDLVVVDGMVRLNDSRLVVLAENGTDSGSSYASQTTYTIIESANAIDGQFGQVVENFAFLDIELDYLTDPTKVLMTLTRNDLTLVDAARTPNQKAAASALTSFNPASSIHGELAGMSLEAVRKAYDSVTGEIHVSGHEAIGQGFDMFGTALGSGGNGSAGQQAVQGSRPGEAVASLLAIDPAGGASGPVHGFWITPFASRGFVETDGNAAAIAWAAGGTALGYETLGRAGGGDLRTGFGLGYAAGRVEAMDRTSTLSSQGFYAGIFGDWSDGATRIKGNAAYGADRVGSSRDISIGAISETALANYWRQNLGLGIEVSHAYHLAPGLTAAPIAALSASWAGHNGFTETGAGALNATFGPTSTWRIDTGLGLELAHETRLASGAELTMRGRALWERGFGDLQNRASVSLAGAAAPFSIAGAEAGRDRLHLGAGVTYRPNDTSSLSLDYAGSFSGVHHSHGAKAGLRVSF